MVFVIRRDIDMARLKSGCGALVLVLVLCGIATPASAEQNVNPSINDYYQGAEQKDWVGVFESPGREVYARRHDVVNALGLKPGMRVADIGAGTGFYTRLFAEQVGKKGKVYAVDIAPGFVAAMVKDARRQGLGQVEGVVNNQTSVALPKTSIDLAFICDTYHHFEYPQTTLVSIRDALRPGGEMVIIDFRKVSGRSSNWVMGHVREGREGVIEEVTANGFELVEDSRLLSVNYMLRFKRTD